MRKLICLSLRKWLRELGACLAEAVRMMREDPTWYEEIEDKYGIF